MSVCLRNRAYAYFPTGRETEVRRGRYRTEFVYLLSRDLVGFQVMVDLFALWCSCENFSSLPGHSI